MDTSSSTPARWQKLGDHSLAATRILDLREVRYRHPARGTERDFIVINAPSWVVALALTPDGQLVFVNQFRFGIDGFSLELPGGVVDLGEDPVAAGVRELTEETGFVGDRARLLGSVHLNPAIQSNRCTLSRWSRRDRRLRPTGIRMRRSRFPRFLSPTRSRGRAAVGSPTRSR